MEEDFSWFGLGGSSSRVCREDEVVKCQQLLQMGGENTAMLPFLIHHFEELCWQARAENKGMIVVLVNSRQRGVAQRGAMLRILHKMECGHRKNWLFWVTETWSSEGRKVFHAYGGDQKKDRILFLVPSTSRNATLLGEIADTETDTHDDILGNIIERAALHITEEGQQREQYAKWRQERKDQDEELENEIRKARELRISEEPQSGRQIKVIDLEGKQWMRKFKETACFQENKKREEKESSDKVSFRGNKPELVEDLSKTVEDFTSNELDGDHPKKRKRKDNRNRKERRQKRKKEHE